MMQCHKPVRVLTNTHRRHYYGRIRHAFRGMTCTIGRAYTVGSWKIKNFLPPFYIKWSFRLMLSVEFTITCCSTLYITKGCYQVLDIYNFYRTNHFLNLHIHLTGHQLIWFSLRGYLKQQMHWSLCRSSIASNDALRMLLPACHSLYATNCSTWSLDMGLQMWIIYDREKFEHRK